MNNDLQINTHVVEDEKDYERVLTYIDKNMSVHSLNGSIINYSGNFQDMYITHSEGESSSTFLSIDLTEPKQVENGVLLLETIIAELSLYKHKLKEIREENEKEQLPSDS